MSAIHQLTAGYTGRDAISNEARALRALFRSWGHPSAIFSNPAHIPRELRGDALPIDDLTPDPEDVALLHLSAGSFINERFRELPCRKVILYHNITPPEYFRGINPELAQELAQGREQVRSLAGVADVVLADSRFNADELLSMGFPDVSVFPLLLNLDDLTGTIDAITQAAYRDGLFNVLFVGRCAPNKAIEEALEAFGAFQHQVEPMSRFLHVGSWAGTELYRDLLRSRSLEWGLWDVELLGTQPQPTLNACFSVADVFLCLSDHEGFCIPLLEAMAHDVPVIAYAAGAVAQTLDGAGILLQERNHGLVAEVMGRLQDDRPFRESILAGQRARLDRYRARDLAGELRGHLSRLTP